MIEGKKIKILQQIKLIIELRELNDRVIDRFNEQNPPDNGEDKFLTDAEANLEAWLYNIFEDLVDELVESEEEPENKGESYTQEQVGEFFEFLGVKK